MAKLYVSPDQVFYIGRLIVYLRQVCDYVGVRPVVELYAQMASVF